MQRALVLALLVVQWLPAVSLSAVSQARLFLRRHAGAPPQADELAELKGQNPEAYALVKALLTKRSLGLLNPRHPTASFAAPSAAQQEQQQTAEQGPEVFAKFARPGELQASLVHQQAHVAQVAVPYAEVQPAVHRDWLNWKPQASAMDDDQMVQNVLGAVAELKGKKAGLLSKHRNSGESALAADEESVGVEAEPVAPEKPKAPPAAPQENGYLKSIDFGIRTPEAPKPEAPHENSYLKGLDLSGDMPKSTESSKQTSQVQSSSANLLSSFSWDDSKPQEQPKVVKPAEPQVESNGKDHSLLSWLGVVKPAAAQKAQPAPAKPSNPYLMDLS